MLFKPSKLNGTEIAIDVKSAPKIADVKNSVLNFKD